MFHSGTCFLRQHNGVSEQYKRYCFDTEMARFSIDVRDRDGVRVFMHNGRGVNPMPEHYAIIGYFKLA